jgi:hypothetical protein
MRNGPCPECQSNQVYYGRARDGRGGLRDEHQVFIPTKRGSLYADTYICLNCGYVRLFLDAKSLQDAASLPALPDWTKAA